MAASAYFDTVQKLYIAFYQRPADSAGLTYWAEQIDAANGNIEAAIQAFSTQEEALELYGEINEDTIGDVIDQIYFAAFGRYAEQEELDYWVPDFIAGNTTPSNIVLAVLLGAQGTDAASVNNKLEVANLFTSLTDGRDPTDPAFGTEPFAATYDGYDDVAAARDLLAGVTDDPDTILSPEDVTTAIVDTIADEGDAIIPVEPPPTFSLTADADSVDEGDTVTFTVEGGKANFTYNYELTGVDATDVEGGVLTGSVTTDADGNGTFEVTLAADRATDGADTLTATLPNTGLSASVTVNDTSLDNVAPVAEDATADAIEDGAVVTGQLAATDADGDALTFTPTTDVQGLTINADGSYSFDPTQNDIVKALTTAGGSTDLVATYTVTDARGATDTGTLTITAAPAPLSFKLEAGATTVNEDGSITFTVTANEAVAAATDVVFTLVPGNSTAVDQGTATTNLNDFGQGAFNPVTVTIPANGTKATFTITPPNDDITELAESFSVQAVVGGQTLTATATLLDGSTGAGKTYMLTKGLDNVPGTSGNDTIIGAIDAGAELNTLSTLDIINGGAGTDTLKIATSKDDAITLGNVSNVEIVEVEGAARVSIDASTTTGVTDLKVLKAGAFKEGTDFNNVADAAVVAKAAAGANINVSLKQAVAQDLAAATDVNAAITVDGGKDVTIAVTDVKAVLSTNATGIGGNKDLTQINVGTTTAAKGDVSVNTTGVKADGANNATLSSITVTGGKTVTVTQKATSDASAAATDKTGGGHKVVQGAVTVDGNADTTTVTVKQDAAVAAKQAVDAIANKDATYAITFKALAKGEKAVLVDSTGGSLTFTASKALTAAEVASAFASLSKGALQGNASTKLGEYSNTGTALVKWASSAVTTVDADNAKVTFSATGAEAGTLVNTGSTASKVTVDTKVTGTTVVPAVIGVLGVDAGKVTITDKSAAHDVLKTITVDGYATGSDIGTGNVTGALNNLTLKNAQGTASMTVADTAATLDLTVEKLGTVDVLDAKTGAITTAGVDAVVVITAAPTTLNVKSVGNNFIGFKAVATETLNVSGTGTLLLEEAVGNDLGGLKSIKVTETAGLTLNHNVGTTNAITSVDTTGTTGTTTITILGDKATYAGGAGVDNVTIGNAGTVISKAVSLGAGDDKLTLTGAVATPTATLDGGTGTNTIAMNNTSAVDVTKNGNLAAKIDNFQKLAITDKQTTAGTVNLANLDNISYVISNGSTAAAAAATKATFTVDLAGTTAITAGDSLAFNGATFNGTGAVTANALALALGGLSYTDWAVKSVSGTTITFEAKVAGTPASVPPAPAIPVGAVFALTDADASSAFAHITSASTAGVAAGANVLTQTIDKLANGGTLELVGASDGVIVQVTDATTGTADVLNVVANAAVTDAATPTDLGKVTANKVETINVEAKDTITGTDVSTNILKIDGDKATTVNVKGAGNLTLTFTAESKALTLVDGSIATGKLNITSVKNDGENLVIKGGLAADTLTSAGQNDKLFGNEGNDVLKAAGAIALVELNGGTGIDSYDVSGAQSKTAASVVRVTNFEKGETIKFVANADASFLNSKFELTGGAGLSDYVGQALAAADAYAEVIKGGAATHGIAWFQQGGNTYVVQDVDGNAAFSAGDIVVELTGLLDLSASSFNDNLNGSLLFI